MKNILLLFLLVACTGVAHADEKLKGIACRSVHLGYPAPVGVAFYNEMIIEKSAEGSYFMVCGWDKGYFGMQELANGKKLVLFSVWDPGEQNDPSTVKEEQRVKLLHKDEQVRVGRFGNEGTGGQSFFDYDWKIGTNYKFFVTAKSVDKRTEYSGYFFVPEQNSWKHLVTFSTPTGGTLMRGYYSFVEDFRRNKVSTTHTRRAQFGHGWVQSVEGKWQPLLQARFTADANPVTNIDAGQSDDGFFYLATGGDIENKTVLLRQLIEWPSDPVRTLPQNLPVRKEREQP
jgi:Domain of unknown function (DUF3472)/Domain of unknown function (DUF5077)